MSICGVHPQAGQVSLWKVCCGLLRGETILLVALTQNANGREGEKRNAPGPFAHHSGCIRQPPHEPRGRVSGAMKGPFTARLHIKNILDGAVVYQMGTKVVRKSTDSV